MSLGPHHRHVAGLTSTRRCLNLIHGGLSLKLERALCLPLSERCSNEQPQKEPTTDGNRGTHTSALTFGGNPLKWASTQTAAFASKVKALLPSVAVGLTMCPLRATFLSLCHLCHQHFLLTLSCQSQWNLSNFLCSCRCKNFHIALKIPLSCSFLLCTTKSCQFLVLNSKTYALFFIPIGAILNISHLCYWNTKQNNA